MMALRWLTMFFPLFEWLRTLHERYYVPLPRWVRHWTFWGSAVFLGVHFAVKPFCEPTMLITVPCQWDWPAVSLKIVGVLWLGPPVWYWTRRFVETRRNNHK